MNIEFYWPWIALLLPLPVLVYVFLPKLEQSVSSLRVPFFQRLSEYHQNVETKPFKNPLMLILCVGLWLSLIGAAMRPQIMGDPQKTVSESRNIMLAVDTSNSMSTEDLHLDGKPVDRLVVVKSVVKEFISRRKGEQIALILFGSQAYLQTPFTFDRDAVQIFMDEAMIGIAGPQTAIGDAIGLAIKKMGEADNVDQVLILLTDGQNNAGEMEPIEVAKLAAARGLKIYTVGVGASEAEISTFFGKQKVNPSQDLDRGEAVLKNIAMTTGAQYFRAKNKKELEEIYSLIDKLEPIQVERQQFRPTRAVYYWPLALAYILSLVLVFLKTNRMSKIQVVP